MRTLTFEKLRTRVLPNLRYLPGTRLRTCKFCQRLSIIISLSPGEETKICVLCGANLRYEMLASYLRALNLQRMHVLELAHASFLRGMLSDRAGHYVPTYFSSTDIRGSYSTNKQARCEDITQLTFPDESFDLIVSSDVLEHVPDIQSAWTESYRVLRPGGSHVFTVPTRNKTQPRATMMNGNIHHLLPPEYHFDPLDPAGILTYWDYGPDLQDVFSGSGLTFSIVRGPEGRDRRLVWAATKVISSHST